MDGTPRRGSKHKKQKKKIKSNALDISVQNKIPQAIKTSLMAALLRERRMEFRDGWSLWKARRDRSHESILFSMEQVRQSISAHRPSVLLPGTIREDAADLQYGTSSKQVTDILLAAVVKKAELPPKSLGQRGQRTSRKLSRYSLAELPILYVYTSFTRQSLEDLVDTARSTMQENMFKLQMDDTGSIGSDDDKDESSEVDLQGFDDSTFITTMGTSFGQPQIGRDMGTLEQDKARGFDFEDDASEDNSGDK
jgi:hypothetical protein